MVTVSGGDRPDETRADVVPDGAAHPGDGARPALRAGFLRELLVAPAGPLARLEVVAESASTNAELARAVAADRDAWPAPALLVAEHQPAGRGRLGRSWTTPPRAALLGSLLLRPDVPREALSWLPLLAGLATARALRATAGVDAVVKWPNDVLVPDPGGLSALDDTSVTSRPDNLGTGGHVSVPGDAPRAPGTDNSGTGGHVSVSGDAPRAPGADRSAPLRKVAGILAEVLPDGGVVVGVGLNVSQTRAELPVPTATSLALAGAATTDREVLLVALQEAFGEVLVRWQDAGGDTHAAGLDADCAEISATLGTRVRVERVAGDDDAGVAVALAPDGGLVVRHDDGTTTVHRSGDVHHLRPAT